MIFGAFRVARYASRAGGYRSGPPQPWPPAVRLIIWAVIIGVAIKYWHYTWIILLTLAIITPVAAAIGKANQTRRDDTRPGPLEDIMKEWGAK